MFVGTKNGFDFTQQGRLCELRQGFQDTIRTNQRKVGRAASERKKMFLLYNNAGGSRDTASEGSESVHEDDAW